MLAMQILSHTPKWVFLSFAGLLWLGVRQMRAGRVGLLRTGLMPLAMGGLSLAGVVGSFGDTPVALLGWAAGAVLLAAVAVRLPPPAATRYDAATRSFQRPGSAAPLALMMGIFFTKYAVGVMQAMHPQLAHQAGFAVGIGTLYGALTGIFVARSLRLWKLALRPDAARFPAAISR